MKGPCARLASWLAIVAVLLFCLDIFNLCVGFRVALFVWQLESRQLLAPRPVSVDGSSLFLNLVLIGLVFALLRKVRAGIIATDPRPATAAMTDIWLIPFRRKDENSLHALWHSAGAGRQQAPGTLHLWFLAWSISLTGYVCFDLLFLFRDAVPFAAWVMLLPLQLVHAALCFLSVVVFESLAKLRDETAKGPGPTARPLRAQRPLETPAVQLAPPEACVACGAPFLAQRCAVCGAAILAGRYRVLSVLRSSPARRTYKAVDGHGRPLALKEIAFASVPDAATLEAFQRESRLLRGLHHQHLPHYLDAFTEGDGPATRFYLAYRWIEGVTLAEELEQRIYQPDEVFAAIAELLQILVYLHGLSPPVLHRDLKPGNIVRDSAGQLVLIDFGTARHLESTWQSGTMVGTVGYMPPEQLAGQVDVTSDLYAVGATALHLLTHSPPWQFMQGPELKLPRLSISGAQLKVLQRLLHPQRQKRFASAREVLRALGKVRPADEPAFLKSSG